MRKNDLRMLLPLVMTFASSVSFSQITQQWVQRYSSPASNTDVPNAMGVDRFGNVYVTGVVNRVASNSPLISACDYVTLKYNSAGVQQWVSTYNGTGNNLDDAKAIAIDFSGNVYVTGKSDGGVSGLDFATIKYNSAGVQQWVARYDGTNNNDEAKAITVDAAGNVYVTGSSSIGNQPAHITTIKYNSTGVQQWVQIVTGGVFNDIAQGIALDLSGNVYVSGWSLGDGTIDAATRSATVKYNSVGTQLWVQRSQCQVNAMTVDISGNVYVTGTRFINGPYVTNFETKKYNTNGVEQWSIDYNNPENGINTVEGIALDLLGNVYVTGSSFSSPGFDYTTIKYNAAGLQQWVSTYNGPANNNDIAHSIAVDIMGNVYVTGESYGSGSEGSFDYATIKYNAAGVQAGEVRYDGAAHGYDEATELALNSPGGAFLSSILALGSNIYISGYSEGIGTGSDIVTIKYTQPFILSFLFLTQATTSPAGKVTNQPGSERQDNFRLSNFPNPFSAVTKIRFDVPVDSRINIRVYDLFGRQVAMLVNDERKRGSYNIDYNATNLRNGVYYCTLVAESSQGRFSKTQKIVVLK